MSQKGCIFCEEKYHLNDTSNSEFSIFVDSDQDGYYIASEYDFDVGFDNDKTDYIKYCPMCGRKLEVRE